jgi:hypothetical protein
MSVKTAAIRLFRVRYSDGDSNPKWRFSVFIVCLVFSLLAWMLIRLSDEYEEIVTIPLTYESPVAKQSLLSSSDSVLTFRARFSGLRILSLRYLEPLRPLQIDLRNLKTRYAGDGIYVASLTATQLAAQLAAVLPLQQEISVIKPDTLYFTFEKTISRKVPIRPKIQFVLSSQHMLTGPVKAVPDSVTLKGPSRLLDTVSGVFTELLALGEISASQTPVARLKKPYRLASVEFSHYQAELHVSVEKFTEVTVEVPIGLPPDGQCRLKVFPDKVNLRLIMPLSRYKDLDKIPVSAFVNCPGIDENTGYTLTVRPGSLPDGVHLVEIQPAGVEFIILNQ